MYLTIFLSLYGDFILTLAFYQQVMEKVVDPSVVSMEVFCIAYFLDVGSSIMWTLGVIEETF